MKYECKRCGYISNHKGNFTNHINRKKICYPILEDMSIENIMKLYNLDKIKKQHPNSTQIPHFSTQNDNLGCQKIKSKRHPNDTQIAPKQHPTGTQTVAKKNMCQFCDKTFTRKTGLTKHLTCCKLKKIENENEKDTEIKELKEIVEKLLVEHKGNTNISNSNNNSHNTTNNIININNYGEEDTKYITGDYILKLLKNRPAKTIPELIKYTHFNDDHPENQNIKITNKKDSYIKVRKNNKWELQDKDETITDLIDRQQIHLLDEDLEKKVEEICNNSEKINIDRCNDLYNEDNKDYMKRLYNESELIIINNS